MNECPVCGATLIVEHDAIDTILCEAYYRCPRQCYALEYAYGYHAVTVRGKTFDWSHTTSQEDITVIQAQIAAAIELAKQTTSVKNMEIKNCVVCGKEVWWYGDHAPLHLNCADAQQLADALRTAQEKYGSLRRVMQLYLAESKIRINNPEGSPQ